ncbi:MAG: nitrilase-related carbon-nitrogen hydrolase [Egibacteraceae bacterium]
MQLAIAQTEPKLGAVEDNIERACDMIAEARAEGADHIVFPELALTGYMIGQVEHDLILRAQDNRLAGIGRAADPAGVVVGCIEDGRSVQTYNSAAYFSEGQLVHVHRKLYLPTYWIFEERKHFSPGQSMRAYSGPGFRMATLICNDAWQAQLAFLAVQDGARLLNVPVNSAQSLFPERYNAVEYWHDINRFLGRMFQTFLVFANRVGAEGQLRFWGGSHVIDPWGRVLGQAAFDTEDLLIVEIDPDQVRTRRRDVPLVREARLGLLEREIRRIADEGGDL